MTFEEAEATAKETPEGAGESQETAETPQASEQASSSQASKEETPAPSVDWTTIDAEELYKHRPELKPKSADEIKAELLASDEVKRQIQSEKDREIAKEKRRLTAEAKRRDKDEADRKARLERQRLLDEEDYEGLGQLEAQRERANEELLKSADFFKENGEQWIRENPEYQVLGDDRVNEIIESVKTRRGNFYEIQLDLAKALSAEEAKRTKEETEKSITERVNEAVEAALAAAGVQQRSKAAEDGEAPSTTIASGGSPKSVQKPRTWTESVDMFNDGLISWEEHKPFFDEHQKQRNR